MADKQSNPQPESNNIINLKKELEIKGDNAVANLKAQDNLTQDNLSKIMEAGFDEFKEKTGRQMTYSEMRELYG